MLMGDNKILTPKCSFLRINVDVTDKSDSIKKTTNSLKMSLRLCFAKILKVKAFDFVLKEQNVLIYELLKLHKVWNVMCAKKCTEEKTIFPKWRSLLVKSAFIKLLFHCTLTEMLSQFWYFYGIAYHKY